MPLQVVMADEHPLFREALGLAVTRAFAGAVVSETDSAATLFAALEKNPGLNLLLLDLDLPDSPGFATLIRARAAFPALPIVVISGRKEPGIVPRTMVHGAAAFVPKSAPSATLIEALRTVLAGGLWVPTHFAALDYRHAGYAGSVQAANGHAGNSHAPIDPGGSIAPLEVSELESASLIARLTPQQFRVLEMLCSGLPNKQIGLRLQVTEATVKAHMRAIMEKFGADNRTQVVLAARPSLMSRVLSRPGEQHAAERHGEADELQRQQRFVKEEIRLDRG